MPTPATIRKRQELQTFIDHLLVPEPCIQAVIAIGSLANGTARPNSDIDALVFMDPLDLYVVPAESVWRPEDNTFHSIFAPGFDDDTCIQLDFQRLDLAQWSNPAWVWPEPRCADLAQGWVAYDQEGLLAPLIAQRTTYDDGVRQPKLDDAITWLDQALAEGKPERCWETLGRLVAMDRLQAAYDQLIAALFALNRVWRPWRNREMSALLGLAWLPDRAEERLLLALNTPSLDRAGYDVRVQIMRELVVEIIDQLVALGDYGDDPTGEAFVRGHDEPGRAWNMDQWNERHQARQVNHD
jgi:hypothetical protein